MASNHQLPASHIPDFSVPMTAWTTLLDVLALWRTLLAISICFARSCSNTKLGLWNIKTSTSNGGAKSLNTERGFQISWSSVSWQTTVLSPPTLRFNGHSRRRGPLSLPPVTKLLNMHLWHIKRVGISLWVFSSSTDAPTHTLYQVKLYFLDGGAEYYATMAESGEPPIPSFSWIIRHTGGRAPYTITEMFKLNAEREKFRARAHAHWNTTADQTKCGRPVDVILTPVAPTLAAPHDSVRWWGYSSYWNLLDYPAVVFPLGRLRASDWEGSTIAPSFTPRNDTEKFIRAQWDPKTYDNAPIGLQVSNLL
jgi:hypothetical protein